MHSQSPKNSYTLPGANRYRKSRNSQPSTTQLSDYGPYPFAANIQQLTKENQVFRKALWTGNHLQLTLMNLLPGEDIGLEKHDNLDQFLYIEQGRGIVMMGDNPNTPNFQQTIYEGHGFIIPAGTWHNLTNIGSTPLKLYSVYSPIQHPFGTIHVTKADANAADQH